MQKRSISIFALSIICLVLTNFAQSTSFSYQGQLNFSNNPASGNYDFEFALFNSASGGSQIGSTLTRSSVAVANGNFTVTLDFGSVFPGDPRFLEIRVRQAGGGGFTTLSPRQNIGSSPYSLRSLSSDTADLANNAMNATALGGVAANQYVRTNDPRLADARSPLPGSNNYIQNQNTAPQSSNFNISGDGKLGGELSATVVSVSSHFGIDELRVFSYLRNSDNTFIGPLSGGAVTSGSENLFVGTFSGTSTMTGSKNSYFGTRTGFRGVDGSGNSYFGYNAGQTRTGSYNSIFGSSTSNISQLFPGDFNSMFGHRAGELTTGSLNTFIGTGSGVNNGSGSSNTFVGHDSGVGNLTGSFNTMLGKLAKPGATNLTNATAIGANSFVSQSNSLVLGSIVGINEATASTNVGIGTTSPNSRLHIRVNGQDGLKIQHTGTGSFPLIKWTDTTDNSRASIAVDTSGTGSMNFWVNGSDRLIIQNNGMVRSTGGIFITNPNTVILTSPNGACWGITVSNSGTLSTFPINPCP